MTCFPGNQMWADEGVSRVALKGKLPKKNHLKSVNDPKQKDRLSKAQGRGEISRGQLKEISVP